MRHRYGTKISRIRATLAWPGVLDTAIVYFFFEVTLVALDWQGT